ncbi:GNAT family N-acetyltransferase [Lewinella cohaerens]|uniref:GNAT family N-acetyltransferase n=1 Tax=Lewinella cohaerens TaxID=70995 RepID=UPI0003734144|nr:GNAT family N-acetyltransferase [Lewinella cohaerens]
MVKYTAVQNDQDLEGILALQAINLPGSISPKEALEQGFLTVVHDMDLLRDMNRPFAHTIAKEGDDVVGYALSMTEDFKERVPVLVPFIERIHEMEWQGQPVSAFRYILMGQVCVAKNYRGQGVFKGLYQKMQERMAPHFDLILTEISQRNPRSIRAHEKVGFVEVIRYQVPGGEPWVVVGLECQTAAVD